MRLLAPLVDRLVGGSSVNHRTVLRVPTPPFRVPVSREDKNAKIDSPKTERRQARISLARAAAGELHECCCWWSWRVRRAVQACALHDGMPWTCRDCGVSAKRRSPSTSVTCRTMRGHLACLPACDSVLSTLCTRAASIQPPACLYTLCTAPPLYSLRGALHHVSHSPLTRCIVMITLMTLTCGASQIAGEYQTSDTAKCAVSHDAV